MLVDSALAQVSRRPTSFFEVSHVSSLLGLVELCLGVAAVPKLALPISNHMTLKEVRLVEPTITRTLGLICRKGMPLSPAAQILYDMVKAEAVKRNR